MQLSSFLASLLMVLPFVNARPATAGDAQWEDLEDVEELDRRNAFSEDAEFEFQPFSLTDVCLDCSRPDAQDLYACVLKCTSRNNRPVENGVPLLTEILAVEWSDPNSVRENNVSSCTCVSNWTWDGVTTASGEKNTYDTQYAICAEDESTYFEMKFVGFDSAENFTLEIAHHYKDDQYGPCPPVASPLPSPRVHPLLSSLTTYS